MTVTYSDATFLRLLFRWRGSVYKAVGIEYLVFLSSYFTINLLYRYSMTADQQKSFEQIVTGSRNNLQRIPLTWILGFYVTSALTRWWDQLEKVSWPDQFLVFLTVNIKGNDDQTRKIRRTFTRWANLISLLVWREISIKIKKRFPTMQHVINAGIMTEEEHKVYNGTTSTYGRWFVPVSWAINLLSKCREEGRITDYAYQKLIGFLWSHRSGSAWLTMYDWVNIPLLYTQAATLATYGYFVLCLVCKQDLISYDPERSGYILFPVITSLEFIFFMGWMKVGKQLRCPFGEDDEDFDMNYILERNLQVAYMLVDELNNQNVEPEQDVFYDAKEVVLPHTMASHKKVEKPPNWRLHKYEVNPKHHHQLPDEKELDFLKHSNL